MHTGQIGPDIFSRITCVRIAFTQNAQLKYLLQIESPLHFQLFERRHMAFNTLEHYIEQAYLVSAVISSVYTKYIKLLIVPTLTFPPPQSCIAHELSILF